MSAALVRVLPGERIPLDGMVAGTAVVVDEQIISGESTPIEKLPGDPVRGGALHLDGDLLLRVTAPSSSGTIARLSDAIREAIRLRGPQQRLADTLAGWFVPVVAVVALSALAVHWPERGFGNALMVSLSVIVIACPCALAIATPLATWIAISSAAQRGILLRHGEALSRLARTTTLCVDKTGTLTLGQPRFVRLVLADGEVGDSVWQAADELARRSRHPLSQSLVASVPACSSSPLTLSATSQTPGRGLTARSDDGHEYLLGSPRFAAERGCTLPSELAVMFVDGTSRRRGVVFAWGGPAASADCFSLRRPSGRLPGPRWRSFVSWVFDWSC